MTVSSTAQETGTETGPPDSGGTKDAAMQSARDVSSATKEQAEAVIDTAKEEAQAVGSEVRQQTRKLATDAQSQLMEHATAQRDTLAENVRSIGQELSKMADDTDDDGMGVQLVRQGGDLATRTAQFLEEREPGQLLDELRQLARRRPGAFLVGAAAAGFLVGRAAKGVKNVHSSDDEQAAPEYSRSDRGVQLPNATTDVSAPPAFTETPAQAETPLATDPTRPTSDSWGPAAADYSGTSGDASGTTLRGSEVP